MIMIISLSVILALMTSYVIYKVKQNSNTLKIKLYENRKYYDRLLKQYIEESYQAIYSKHVLPFIANGVMINTNEKDKFFLSISKNFLDVLRMKLGSMIEIYRMLYGSEQKFIDYVLLELSIRIQIDMADTVLSPNLNELTEQNRSESNQSE